MFYIELREDDHDAHPSPEEEDFVKCWPVMVHAESEDEAKEIAHVVSEHFGGDS